jgi:hypothetical protein
MKLKYKLLSLLFLSIALCCVVYALTTSKTVHNTGGISPISTVGLAIYSDSGYSQILSSISWGTITEGNSATYTIYVKNTGNTVVTLSMATSNPNPTTAFSSGDLTLSWNYAGTTLSPNGQISITLTLSTSSASANDFTTFSFDITITATS